MLTRAAFALTLATTTAMAYEYSVQDAPMRVHRILARNVSSVIITLEVKTQTDGCNSYFLMGEFLPVRFPPDTTVLHQPYLGSFSVGQTEMACLPPRPGREITLTRASTFPANRERQVGLELWLPADITVKIQERR